MMWMTVLWHDSVQLSFRHVENCSNKSQLVPGNTIYTWQPMQKNFTLSPGCSEQ